MSKRDVYENWLESRRNRRVPEEFASRVMERVEEMEDRQKEAGRVSLAATLAAPLSRHRITRLILGCSLSALGVYRVVHVAVTLLIP